MEDKWSTEGKVPSMCVVGCTVIETAVGELGIRFSEADTSHLEFLGLRDGPTRSDPSGFLPRKEVPARKFVREGFLGTLAS